MHGFGDLRLRGISRFRAFRFYTLCLRRSGVQLRSGLTIEVSEDLGLRILAPGVGALEVQAQVVVDSCHSGKFL